jgi:hypothetical protein
MGAVSSQTLSQNQKVSNSVLQISNQNCNATCTAIQDNNTIIIIDSNTGDLELNNVCTIDDYTCTINNYFDSNIETILKSMAEQNAQASTGFTFDFHLSNQMIDLNQLIENSVTQIQKSSCQISAFVEQNNNFIYAENSTTGDVVLNNNGNITNSSCKLDNTAKSTTDADETAESSQTSKFTSIIAMFIILIIICVVIGGIVAIVGSVSKPKKGGNATKIMVPKYNPKMMKK